MPKKPGHGKVKQHVKMAQAEACARAIMLALGVDPSLLPVDKGPKVWERPTVAPRAKLVIPTEGQRLRRSKRELREVQALQDWQLQRRAGEVSNFVLYREEVQS